MKGKVLVAYATLYGSTGEVADAVGARLREQGLAVDVKPVKKAREQLDTALEKMPWLRPVAADMFVGKYDPSALRFCHRLVTKLPASPLHGLGPHDDRDWDAIGAWADGVGKALLPAQWSPRLVGRHPATGEEGAHFPFCGYLCA